MRPKGQFAFDRIDGGTRVTFPGNPNPIGIFKVATPIFVLMGDRVWREGLARAKAVLEAAGGPRTS
jgi:hypothetical protein